MSEEGLIHALLFDGKGGARQLDWHEVRQWTPGQGVLWVHFDYTDPGARDWVLNGSGLDRIAAEALVTEETRPRTTVIDDAMLLALRGVNLNPGSDPEDMVSIRAWVSAHRIISSRKRRLISAAEILESFQHQRGPKNAGDFVVDLAHRLTARMEDTMQDLEDRVDLLEEDVITAKNRKTLRNELSALRREAIILRRYLAPQREAMSRLFTEKVDWMNDDQRMRLREITDKVIRYIEDLDSIRDRASVIQEELVNTLSEQMNARMYMLSIVAALFLPLGFLTGLLGINVGGIPGAENPWGFYLFGVFLLAVIAVQIWVFRMKHWL